jgi:toxin YoeB
MRIQFTPEGFEHYLYWQKADPKLLDRINELIRSTARTPFSGIGKPEPLRNDLKGWWSRRIDSEHRLVYRVIGKGAEQALEIAACRFHYGE